FLSISPESPSSFPHQPSASPRTQAFREDRGNLSSLPKTGIGAEAVHTGRDGADRVAHFFASPRAVAKLRHQFRIFRYLVDKALQVLARPVSARRQARGAPLPPCI